MNPGDTVRAVRSVDRPSGQIEAGTLLIVRAVIPSGDPAMPMLNLENAAGQLVLSSIPADRVELF